GGVVLLAADRVADDNRATLSIHGLLGPSEVQQRLPRERHRPLLAVIELLAHAWRDRQLPREGIPLELTHPAADRRVRLAWRLGVGVVVQRRVPTLGRDVGDAVLAALDVGPEGSSVRRL